MMTERYEEGMQIISVETEDEFVEALDQMTNYRVAIEAPEAIMDAYGIESAEELGIEPDDPGYPPRPEKEAAGTDFRLGKESAGALIDET